LSKFGLFVVLAVAVGLTGYLLLQIRNYNQVGYDRTGSVQLAEDENPNSMAKLFAKKASPTSAPKTAPTSAPNAVPTFEPRPLPKGEQEYSIRLGDEAKGPKFMTAKVSEYTLSKTSKQTVAVFIDKSNPATAVTGSLATDSKETPLNFTLVGEENNTQKWQADWVLNDSVNVTYGFRFSAVGAGGQTKAAIGER